MQDIQDKITQKLIEQLDLDPDDVTMEARFIEDLEMDSLDMVEMVISIEKETGIAISNDEAKELKTVGDLMTFLEGKQDA